MKAFVKAMDGLPWIVKVILALPFFDGIAWGLYRLIKGLSKKDTTLIIVGLIWIFFGLFIFWIIDLFTLFTKKNVTFFA
jgi:hypothetical protein